jgi:hypothetical protein
MELLAKHKRVPRVPSSMGQLTIKQHPNSLSYAVVLNMACRP